MKRTLISIFIAIIISPLYSAQYFIAADGDDMNPGTIVSPFGGFDKAYSVAQPGDTIWVRGGKHTVSTIWSIAKAGNVNAYYNLWGYTPDILSGDSVILNVTASNGIRIQLGGQFWHIKGLVIQNSSDNGMRIEGSYNIIENCTFRYNSDSGLTIQQSNGTMPNDGSIASYNLVLNCDSYYNDKNTDNADGFACKLSPGAGNVFRGCRSWANGDDGWDFYYSRFQIIVEDCWTFRNGLKGGNGNGFKSNGSASSSSTPRTQAPHVYIRCIAFDHKYKTGSNNKGFDQNHNEGNVTMINCLSFDNEKNYAYQEDTQNGKNHVLRNCVGFEPYSETLKRTLLPGEIINAGTKDEISYESSNTWFGNTIDASFNSWNLAKNSTDNWNPSREDYQSLSLNDALAPRKPDGSLPDNGFGKLKHESRMKNAGITYEWELIENKSKYPANPDKPYYILSTLVTTIDGLPDLGPFEIPSEIRPENKKPVVSITSPQNGTEFILSDKINIAVSATDEDGTISRVEFYAQNNLLGLVYAQPYLFDWSPATSGNFSIIAKAYDNEGAVTVSEPVNIIVKVNSGNSNLGQKSVLLKLTGTSFTDEIQNKAWVSVNSTSISNSHIKLTYSSSKGGTIISPAIDLIKYLPDSLILTFASSGGGSRNLNIYMSSDGGATWSSAYVQAGAANGVAVPVKMKLSDKISGDGSFLLKLEAANTVEVWNIQMTGFEKLKSGIENVRESKFRCYPTITDGKLEIENLASEGNIEISVFNALGIETTSCVITNSYINDKFYLDLSNNSRGIYIVKLSTNTENTTFRVFKK